MKFLPLFLILILSGLQAVSQHKYAAADSLAAVVKGASVIELHKALTKNLSKDEDKVRAFYSWIAYNIHYDVSEWKQTEKAPEKQAIQAVLKSKKAICHGYAVLFSEFCRLSAIPCYLVSGYNRLDNKFDDAGHTWNMVFVNKKWQPVDVTWGAGGIDPRGKYIKEFENKYFLPDPVDFLSDHFPFDPMWQLVEHPVKLSDYRNERWKYQVKSTPYFNFNDTIAAWEQLDSLDREYTSAVRMLNSNPGDPKVKLQLSYALFKKGNAEFDKGNKIMAVLYPRKPNGTARPAPVRKEFKAAQLDSISIFYNSADYYYRQVQFSSSHEKTVLKNNLEALKNNRSVVSREKTNLSR
ncbi:MAG: hypothetical protein M3Q95_00565 [Bacteroidota bacterium]|nr:hypothetical protein [Bacteroidota bacterium]